MKQTILEKINQREYQILVHSFLYYKLDKNIIDDSKFDFFMYDLVELMKNHENEFLKSVFYSEFKSFEGGTGADLRYDTEQIKRISMRLIGSS